MAEPITVVIPVGPAPHHKRWLVEAICSAEIEDPAQILLIDDMANLPGDRFDRGQGDGTYTLDGPPYGGCTIWKSPWRLGVGGAFNAGVALAQNDLVLMLGGDDRLLPGCLEAVLRAYHQNTCRRGYYWLGVRYSDGRADQYLPCNAAAVTKGLWRDTGGFPLEAVVAPDAALISILMTHAPGYLQMVSGEEPYYWYRVHQETDTAKRGPWQKTAIQTRDLATSTWKKPAWGRY